MMESRWYRRILFELVIWFRIGMATLLGGLRLGMGGWMSFRGFVISLSAEGRWAAFNSFLSVALVAHYLNSMMLQDFYLYLQSS